MDNPQTCECCSEPNMGGLIDPKLTYACIDCVEDGQAELDCNGEHYRMVLSCRCGHYGAVNYDDGHNIAYYCGGSERCIP